jgi:glycosyltransferase involved in cell wall biosynthesis
MNLAFPHQQAFSPIKALHFFHGLARGGAEMRTLDVMRSIDRKKFQFDFCTFAKRKGELEEEVTTLGGRIHRLQFGPMLPYQLWQIQRQHQYDIFHSHLLFFSGLLMAIARTLGIQRRIAHFRTSDPRDEKSFLRQTKVSILKRLIDKYATDIVGVSEVALHRCWRPNWQSDSRCRVLYNGIDDSKFPTIHDRSLLTAEFGIPPTAHAFLHVGRFSPPKNHLRLLNIFASIKRRDPYAVLLLVGLGDSEGFRQAQLQASSLGIQDSVVFAGLRDDVGALMAASDVFIFPSLWEGLPGAVLEASAVGLPIVASAIEPTIEIQRHIPHIVTLPLEESDEVWASACLAALGKKPDRSCFLSSPFTLERTLSEYQRLYNPEPLALG